MNNNYTNFVSSFQDCLKKIEKVNLDFNKVATEYKDWRINKAVDLKDQIKQERTADRFNLKDNIKFYFIIQCQHCKARLDNTIAKDKLFDITYCPYCGMNLKEDNPSERNEV